jgi:hypothetical protein
MPGENTRANHRKNRHRLGSTIDRRAPLLARQEKDRGNQRSRVADADPKDEVRNVPRPAGRMVLTPNSDAIGNLIANAKQTEKREASGREKGKPPPQARPFLGNRGHVVRDPSKAALVLDERHALHVPWRL